MSSWLTELLRFVVVSVAEQFFGVMERVGVGLAAISVGRGNPFGIAVGVFAGAPAWVGQFVVGAAGEGQLIDVGGGELGERSHVVDFIVDIKPRQT